MLNHLVCVHQHKLGTAQVFQTRTVSADARISSADIEQPSNKINKESKTDIIMILKLILFFVAPVDSVPPLLGSNFNRLHKTADQ